MYRIDKSLNMGLSLALMAVFGLSALTACQKSQDNAADAVQSGIVRPSEDIIVAKVGGEAIFYSDVRDAAARLGLESQMGLAAHNEKSPKALASNIAPMNLADFNMILDRLISHKLLAQDAMRIGADQTELAQKRLSGARDLILSSIRLEAYIRETVTEEKLRKLYETQAALANLGDEIRARHIILESKEDAVKLAAQIKEDADFEALALKHSIDTDTRDRGGDLGYFTYDMLPPDFVKPIFASRKGKRLSPFKTSKGWHIVQILDRRRPGAKNYEDSREALRDFLTLEAIQELTERLKRSGDVIRVPLPLELPADISPANSETQNP